MNTKHRKKVAFVMTVPSALRSFMAEHIRALAKRYDVTIYCNFSVDLCHNLFDETVRLVHIPFERKISLWNDVKCFYTLFAGLLKGRFDIIHSLMPKTGLLAMTAGWLVRTPVRIHWFMGQVWVTRRGMARLLLRSLDRLMAVCATRCLSVSHSERQFLLSEGITNPDKIHVLANGSVCGVDTKRFIPSKTRRNALRDVHKISVDATISLYVGRLNRDKGIPELAYAFSKAANQCKNLHLIVVGPDEDNMKTLMLRIVGDAASRLHFVGFSHEPEAYMTATDYIVLPSHREGFGLTIIEAAACGIPSIGSRVYGLRDAIIDGQTGILVPVGDVDSLAKAMVILTNSVDFRLRLGEQALMRVLKDFQTKHLTDALMQYYESLWTEENGNE